MNVWCPCLFNRQAQSVGWAIDTKAHGLEDSGTSQSHRCLGRIKRCLNQNLRCIAVLVLLAIRNQLYFFLFNTTIGRQLATSNPQSQLAFIRALVVVMYCRYDAMSTAFFRCERAVRGVVGRFDDTILWIRLNLFPLTLNLLPIQQDG